VVAELTLFFWKRLYGGYDNLMDNLPLKRLFPKRGSSAQT